MFKAPDPNYQRRNNQAWRESQSGDLDLGDREELWGKYWDQFNTIRIPILSPDAYVKVAVTVAKDASSPEDFENRFREFNRRSWDQLESDLAAMRRKIYDMKEKFSCQDAYDSVSAACRGGCLEHYVNLLKGNINGWEADPVEPDCGKGDSACEHNLYIDMNYDRSGPLEPFRPPPRKGSVIELDDNLPLTIVSANEASSPKAYLPPTSNGTSIVDKNNKGVTKLDSSGMHLNSPPSHITDGDSPDKKKIKKRTRFEGDEDDNGDDSAGCQFKRQKLDTDPQASSTPREPTPIPQATGGSVPKKRSRTDLEDEGVDTGFKRQKTASFPPPPSKSSTTSLENISTDPPPINQGGVSTKKTPPLSPKTVNGGRRHQNRAPKEKATRTGSSQISKTSRPSRRSRSSKLWELDSSGKPRMAEAGANGKIK
ncbi:hypothetical protein V8C35DRAFT_307716 [Trichoderma chlorosporum]